MSVEKHLRALELKIRNLIVEIVPMVKAVPASNFSGLNEFLDTAIEGAKASLDITKQDTERRTRLTPAALIRQGLNRPIA